MPRLSVMINRIKWCMLGVCVTLLLCHILLAVMDKLAWNYPASRLNSVRERIEDAAGCRRVEASESLENLAGTKWQIKDIRDIKPATIHTAIENPDVKPIGCGIAFTADVEQTTETGECVTSKVAVKSVFTNLSHYQGESHLREIKTHYLDRVLGTGLTVPSSLVVLPFSALKGERAEEVKRAVDCDISDKALFKTGVTAYVAGWVNNLGTFPKLTPSLAERIHPDNFFTYVSFLYIANCMKSGHSHFANAHDLHYVMIDNDRCLLPEKVSALEMPLHYRKRLTRLTSTLFRDGHVCSVPAYLIEHLQVANAASSGTPSVGSQLRKMVAANETTSRLLFKEDPEIYEETDGRVSTLLAEYNHRCEAHDVSKFDGEVYTSFKESEVTDAYLVDDKEQEIKLKLEDGLSGMANVVSPNVGMIAAQPALAELFAFYVDRLTGINKMPTVVYRQLHPDNAELKDIMTSLANLDHSIPDYHTTLTESKLLVWGNESAKPSQNHVPSPVALKKLNVVIVGKMKRFHTKVHIHHEGSLRDFFRHEASFRDLEKSHYSRQTLLDLADIFLLDFLMHRPDRKHVGKSELRLVSTGNDQAWWAYPNLAVCSAILRCPPLLYKMDWSHRPYWCNETCGADNTYFSNCRFRETTVQRIRHIHEEGWTLGMLLEVSVKSEDGLSWILGDELTSIMDGLDARVQYLMKYIGMCARRHGEGVLV